jgi:hypothetical protein
MFGKIPEYVCHAPGNPAASYFFRPVALRLVFSGDLPFSSLDAIVQVSRQKSIKIM